MQNLSHNLRKLLVGHWDSNYKGDQRHWKRGLHGLRLGIWRTSLPWIECIDVFKGARAISCHHDATVGHQRVARKTCHEGAGSPHVTDRLNRNMLKQVFESCLEPSCLTWFACSHAKLICHPIMFWMFEAGGIHLPKSSIHINSQHFMIHNRTVPNLSPLHAYIQSVEALSIFAPHATRCALYGVSPTRFPFVNSQSSMKGFPYRKAQENHTWWLKNTWVFCRVSWKINHPIDHWSAGDVLFEPGCCLMPGASTFWQHQAKKTWKPTVLKWQEDSYE